LRDERKAIAFPQCAAAEPLRDKKERIAFDVAQDGSKNYQNETNKKRFAQALKLLEVPLN
jgi:hypothetical protein